MQIIKDIYSAIGKMTTADELLKVVKAVRDTVLTLPNQEQTKYHYADTEADKALEEDITKDDTTEEQAEKAEDDIANKGEDTQTEESRIDESVGEQEEQMGDEDSQDAKDRVDESEATMEDDDDAEKEEEASEALALRIDGVEEKLAKLSEQLEEMLTHLESNKNFGASPSAPMADGEVTDDDRVMQDYYKGKYRK